MTENEKISIDEFENVVKSAENDYNHSLLSAMGKLFIVAVLFAVYMIIPKTFWLIPSGKTNETLNPYQEPVMKIYNDLPQRAADRNNYIKLKGTNGKFYYLLPAAEYSITARIIEKNRFFYIQSDFDKIALVDYGLAWGDMAKNEYFYKIYGHSNQTIDARRLVINFKDKYYKTEFDKYHKLRPYLFTHVSHTHVIPANKNVAKAIRTARRGQVIKMDGYLVDSYNENFWNFSMSSLSLSDVNESARGGGACEVMYVNKVQIGNKVFE